MRRFPRAFLTPTNEAKLGVSGKVISNLRTEAEVARQDVTLLAKASSTRRCEARKASPAEATSRKPRGQRFPIYIASFARKNSM